MKIVYWSDYACPYCYIGEKRLETVIDELGLKKDIEIEMKAFELDPNASREVQSRTDERFAKKYGMSLEDARDQIEKISNLGRAEGIDFKYAETQYTNMLDAHRLTKFVAAKGKDVEKVIHLLFDAYFTKDLKLSDRKILADIAKQVEINEDELNAMLDSEDFINEVRKDENEAYALGVHGVPFFMIDGKFTIPGAQSEEGIKQTLLLALNNRLENSENGMSCGPDGCH
ncbi:MAG: DsbA family oxidoreductase [Alphaproteobacteria bacterium]|nr:DsbA family oxidoreductase [Alphaproteobacteria bacterium]